MYLLINIEAIYEKNPLVSRTIEINEIDINNTNILIGFKLELDVNISIKGRHDPMIVPRAVVVVEAMAALTVLDLMMANMTSKMDYLKEIYKK